MSESSYAIIELSEGATFHDRGSDQTLIWFGGIHEPFLSPAFLPFGWNLLTLIDRRSDWYIDGVEGFGDSLEETVDRLSAVLGGHRKVFAGQSSGGYGALRFHYLLDGDLAIAYAPQIKNITVDGAVMPWVNIASLEDLYFGSDERRGPIILHLSTSEDQNPHSKWGDWQHIEKFKTLPQVTTVCHPFHIHAVSLKLRAEDRFYRSILGSINMFFDT